MIVHFGQHLDGQDPRLPSTEVGVARLGPLGLLAALETDLGLPPASEHPAREIARYRACLAAADDLTRFFHASFAVDPIGVAKTLLAWRAIWYEHGWDGDFTDAPPRLADMAAVERVAPQRPVSCIGQRLRAIEAALNNRRTQIERLILLDHIDELPLAWQRVIRKIGYETAPSAHLMPTAPAETDLGRLQAALLDDEDAAGPTPPATPEPLRTDGTLVMLHSASRDLSARAVAECLRGIDPASAVVVAPQDGFMLDNALENVGLPRCGFQHRSRFRPSPQVLKLVLALLWAPLNPRLVLQFLQHPIAPLPRDIRSALAGAMAQSPGIGGPAWRTAIEAALKARTERDMAAAQAQATAEQGSTAPTAEGDTAPFAATRATEREAIRYWLEGERFPATSGAPIEVVAERAQRCANWLAGRAATQSGEAGLAAGRALRQCRAFLDSLAALGAARIGKLELDRLLLEAATPEPGTTDFAGAGHVRSTTHPAAVTERFDHTVWWGFGAKRLDLAWPWSPAELDALAAAGVRLPDAETRLRRMMHGWLRPIVNCRRRLVLVLLGEDGEHHPLWRRIQHRFTGWAETTLDEALFEGTATTLPQLDVPTPQLAPRPPSTPQRWWQLPSDIALPAREVESYTSLSKLYDFPHAWALRYLARLRPGRAAQVPDRALLYGSLAHRVLERLFAEPDWAQLTPAKTRDWLDATLPSLIATEGAVLLERGRGADRLYFIAVLERALPRLLSHLNAAHVVHVETERQEQQPSGDFALQGSIDLFMRTAAGREIVMDAKWAGEPWRLRDLADNRHLQLAVYAWLRRAAGGGEAWPHPAYFIITTGNVLAPDRSVFPHAVARRPTTNEGIEDLWRRMEATYAWRRDQLARGRIEVPVRGTEADEDSEPPANALARHKAPDPFEEFGWLVGRVS